MEASRRRTPAAAFFVSAAGTVFPLAFRAPRWARTAALLLALVLLVTQPRPARGVDKCQYTKCYGVNTNCWYCDIDDLPPCYFYSCGPAPPPPAPPPYHDHFPSPPPSPPMPPLPPMAVRDPCSSSCDPVTTGAKPGADVASGTTAILEGTLAIMRAKGTLGEGSSDLGYAGLGIMTIAMGGISGFKDSSAMMVYDLEKFIIEVADYLVCKMEEIVSEAVYSIEQTLQQQQLNCFSTGVQGVVQQVANRCGAWNCLNATNLPPSERNAAVGADCVGAGAPYPADACAGVTTWDPKNPTPCTTYTYSAHGAAGFCGTNGLCWFTNVDFTTVLAETNSFLNTFMKNSCVNNMQALNAYYDSAAMVAYAQASLVQLALIQQKVLLGSHDGSDEQYMATAGANAAWMQARLNYNLDWERNYEFIASLSYMSDQKLNGRFHTKGDKCCNGYCGQTTYKFTPDDGDACAETLHVRRDCNANETVHHLSCATQNVTCPKTMVFSSCSCCSRDCKSRSSCEDKVYAACYVPNCPFDANGCAASEATVFRNETNYLVKDLNAQLVNLTTYMDQMYEMAATGLDASWYAFYPEQYYPKGTCKFVEPYASGVSGFAATALPTAGDVACMAADALAFAFAADAGSLSASLASSSSSAAAAIDGSTTKKKNGNNAKTTPLALLALGVVGVVSDGEVTSSSGSSGFAQGTIETDRLTAMLNSKDKIVAKLVRCSALWSTLQAGKGKLRVSEGAAYAVVGATGALARATVSARDGSTLTLAPGCTGSVVVVASESVAESHKYQALSRAPAVHALGGTLLSLTKRYLQVTPAVDAVSFAARVGVV